MRTLVLHIHCRCGGLLFYQITLKDTHTHTHTYADDSCGRVISPTQIPLPINIQHLQDIDIHAPCGIRTLSPSVANEIGILLLFAVNY